MAEWGSKATATTARTPAKARDAGAEVVYDRAYYLQQFTTGVSNETEYRMALVGHENTAKTGLAASLLHDEIMGGETVFVFDVDNSARSTLDFIYPDKDNLKVIPLLDENDDSIFHEDNSINYPALIDKTKYYINIIGDLANEGNVGGVIFDGGSTFLKWCEFAMRQSLLNKGIIENEDDSFNQKEWRERNRLNRDVITRVHALPISKIFFTYHLKAIQQYMDDGTGKKVLMSVGERPDWEKGTMRKFSQQIFLSRYMTKADMAAGVKGDRKLKKDEWVVRATIEEMKGRNMEHGGSIHDLLTVENGTVTWKGLPFLTPPKPEVKTPEPKTEKA
mgnify:CR=1 FL=1